METKLGLQMWSVRNNLEKDFVGTLEKIADIGYKYIQVNSFSITPQGMIFGKDVRASELRKHLDRLGLKAVSAHFLPTPEMRLETIVDDLNTIGADTLACAAWFWSTPREVIEWNKRFDQYGEFFKRNGIQLYYHNHFHEFQVLGDRSIFEMLVDGSDKDLVMFEFDTYWSVRGGQDPIYWLKKLGKRCDLIHQKDMPATTKPVNLFERFGYDANFTIDVFNDIQDVDHFTEVGDGSLDIPLYIRSLSKYNNPKYIFIEQDFTSRTELESIEVSFTRMTKLMAAS
jgi:sugar phosphate isomerase/epimerase